MQYDFHQKEPLSGDLHTKFVKRKTHAKGSVLAQDSNKPNTTLLMSPVTHGLKRCNLEETKFINISVTLERVSMIVSNGDESDDVRILPTPP